ncbi:unnamed protein product [Ectocarpus fasciculatus]
MPLGCDVPAPKHTITAVVDNSQRGLLSGPSVLVSHAFFRVGVVGVPTTTTVLHEISTILDTGLDRKTLSLLLELIESGVNPEALAAVVKELRREAATLSRQR